MLRKRRRIGQAKLGPRIANRHWSGPAYWRNIVDRRIYTRSRYYRRRRRKNADVTVLALSAGTE